MLRFLLLVMAALTVRLATDVSPAEAQGRRWGEGYLPNLPVVDQDGRTLRFYDEVIKGRIVVISFIYTKCTDICPLTVARLAQVAEHLGGEVGRSIHFVSISVDPLNDTPAKLADYAAAFHSGPGWTFLTGRIEDIKAINAKLGERMRSLNEHRNEILLGNDATGEWQRNSVFIDLARLALDIRSMDPAWRAKERIPGAVAAADTGYLLSSAPGQALFTRLCSACHSVGAGLRVGPDLSGVSARRGDDWLIRFIMSPERMRAERDPAALQLARDFPSVRMPNLGLSKDDAADLVAYVRTRTEEASGNLPSRQGR